MADKRVRARLYVHNDLVTQLERGAIANRDRYLVVAGRAPAVGQGID